MKTIESIEKSEREEAFSELVGLLTNNSNKNFDKEAFLIKLSKMSKSEAIREFFEVILDRNPNLEKLEIMFDYEILNTEKEYYIGSSLLHWACQMQNPIVAEFLLDKGSDVNAKSIVENTPLFVSHLMIDDPQISKLLLEKGADVEAKDKWGNTTLHWVSESDALKVAELLLERGADVRAKNDDGETPLDKAKTKEMRALLQKYL